MAWLLPAATASARREGWEYLIDKLVADGVDRQQVEAAFDDPRVPAFDGLEFSVHQPREPRALYRGFLRPSSVAAAQRCRMQHAAAFERAERVFGVSADLLAAILHVESGCGHHTGTSLIFYRLARLAMANEPDNLESNLRRYRDDTGSCDPNTEAQLRSRARFLEQTFYPEVRGIFDVAQRMGVTPLDLRGSRSGAFGYPQFLPTSYLKYAADGDDDGRISLYDTDDAVASCAKYFAGHGWRPGLTSAQRRAAVWQYNRSDAYVDAVLTLAARMHSPVVQTARKSTHKGGRHKPKRRALAARQKHKARG